MDELDQKIRDVIAEMAQSSLTCPFHTHTQTDGGQLDGSKAILGAPQAKLTAATGGALSTGGAAVLSGADSTIITNAITRLGQIETKLTTLGFLKST